MRNDQNRDQVLKDLDNLDKLVVDLIKASLHILVDHDFTMLDKGIGTNTKTGQRWLTFRKAVNDIKKWVQVKPRQSQYGDTNDNRN